MLEVFFGKTRDEAIKLVLAIHRDGMANAAFISARHPFCQPSPPGPRWWRPRQGEPLGLTPPPVPIFPHIVDCRRNNSPISRNPAICASSATVTPVVVGVAGGPVDRDSRISGRCRGGERVTRASPIALAGVALPSPIATT
jgi:hypothetical protein